MRNVRSTPIVITLPDWFSGPITVIKELHVLLPIALSGFVLMLLSRFLREPDLSLVFLGPYAISCAVIGAWAAGHDFTYRTFGSLLSLPVPRHKIWARRMFLAGLVMLPLTALAMILGTTNLIIQGPNLSSIWFTWGVNSFFSGLCVAPWLTLISRSPLFGAIFSLGITPLLAVIVNLIATAADISAPEAFTSRFMLVALPTLWIVSAILGWRKFIALEITDSAPADPFVTKITRSRAVQRFRRTSPTWQLFKKEIMLQRIPILLASIAVSITLLLKGEYAALASIAYPGLIIILIGSVASADERQIGAAEWQTLMPMAFWKQWLIKLLTTWAIALIFGAALPFLAVRLKSDEFRNIPIDGLLMAVPPVAAGVLLITVVTIYVSSLCNSSVKALMFAILANFFLLYFGGLSVAIYSMFLQREKGSMDWLSWDAAPFAIAVVGLVALLIRFTMKNHRYADRGPNRILRQLMIFGAYTTLAIAAIFSFWNAVTL